MTVLPGAVVVNLTPLAVEPLVVKELYDRPTIPLGGRMGPAELSVVAAELRGRARGRVEACGTARAHERRRLGVRCAPRGVAP